MLDCLKVTTLSVYPPNSIAYKVILCNDNIGLRNHLAWRVMFAIPDIFAKPRTLDVRLDGLGADPMRRQAHWQRIVSFKQNRTNEAVAWLGTHDHGTRGLKTLRVNHNQLVDRDCHQLRPIQPAAARMPLASPVMLSGLSSMQGWSCRTAMVLGWLRGGMSNGNNRRYAARRLYDDGPKNPTISVKLRQ